MTILEEISNLIILSEDEYYGSFYDRHRGKILGGAALLGAGALAHSGYLGTGAQDFVNTNLRMAGRGAHALSAKLGGLAGNAPAAQVAAPVAQVATPATRAVQATAPIINPITPISQAQAKAAQIAKAGRSMGPNYGKLFKNVRTKTMGEITRPISDLSLNKNWDSLSKIPAAQYMK